MTVVNWILERASGRIERVCEFVAARIKIRRTIDTDGAPYLTRHYLHRDRDGQGASAEQEDSRVGAYLHYFHRGDEDAALHNHSFGWSCNLILTNGYEEERWDPRTQTIKKRRFRPGSVNLIRANDFHRVDFFEPSKGAWVLVVSGKRVRGEWGFWWPGVHGFIPHYNFTRNRVRDVRPS